MAIARTATAYFKKSNLAHEALEAAQTALKGRGAWGARCSQRRPRRPNPVLLSSPVTSSSSHACQQCTDLLSVAPQVPLLDPVCTASSQAQTRTGRDQPSTRLFGGGEEDGHRQAARSRRLGVAAGHDKRPGAIRYDGCLRWCIGASVTVSVGSGVFYDALWQRMCRSY